MKMFAILELPNSWKRFFFHIYKELHLYSQGFILALKQYEQVGLGKIEARFDLQTPKSEYRQ